jgi:NAD-dependent protein deacetylase/lipoamidase
LKKHTDEFLLVTQNVDDLHARAGIEKENMVQIHGDIFVARCSRCEFKRHEYEHPPSPRLRRTSKQEPEHEGVVPRCPKCQAFMRPGVVWFGEQLSRNELERVENFLDGGACNVVIVAGTTATFGYIIDWALRAKCDRDGELIEVNLEETPLSQFSTRLVREPAAVALPKLVEELTGSSPQV